MGWGSTDKRETNIIYQDGYQPGSQCPKCHQGNLCSYGAMETGRVFCPKCDAEFNGIKGIQIEK